MQVPPDLASRITRVAESFGRSPEAFLREAISRLLESTAPAVALPAAPASSNAFAPQPQGFSVYE